MINFQEIEPDKKYFLTFNGWLKREDLEYIKQRLESEGIKNVFLITNVDIKTEQAYFGLYCEQCGVWYRKPAHREPWVVPLGGDIIYYPAPEIAQAELNELQHSRMSHIWKVTEFGKEKFIATLEDLPFGTTLCPVAIEYRVNNG